VAVDRLPVVIPPVEEEEEHLQRPRRPPTRQWET